jgi:hypothetical protein
MRKNNIKPGGRRTILRRREAASDWLHPLFSSFDGMNEEEKLHLSYLLSHLEMGHGADRNGNFVVAVHLYRRRQTAERFFVPVFTPWKPLLTPSSHSFILTFAQFLRSV